jgi:uncharacterized protein (DUF433 family)
VTSQATVFKGIVHGKTIELEQELDLPDGEAVTVMVRRTQPTPPPEEGLGELPRAELWADRLVFDSSVLPGERIVEGTRLAAEALVAELEQGRGDEEMLQAHPELTREDLAALRVYARVPVGFRLSFGAWAEDGEELDRYIESVYERRRVRQRPPLESFEP